ncbi:MAG TPA: hypothetical protein VFA18_04895, partial [Gemmataceae bacterium]|nr:hypothetical protein [Gemmataceae bacterium]
CSNVPDCSDATCGGAKFAHFSKHAFSINRTQDWQHFSSLNRGPPSAAGKGVGNGGRSRADVPALFQPT